MVWDTDSNCKCLVIASYMVSYVLVIYSLQVLVIVTFHMDVSIGMIICQVDVLEDSIMCQLRERCNATERSYNLTRTFLLYL